MKELDPKKWIQDVKKFLTEQPLESFNLAAGEEGEFFVPFGHLGFFDIDDEIYDDGDKPYSGKEYGDEYQQETDYGGFDFVAEFESVVMPELERVAAEANVFAGGDYFSVEQDGSNAAANLDFRFSQEDIPDLQAKGILAKQPNLAAVLASGRAFSDFQGPLFENAKVEVTLNMNPEGRSIPDPQTAKLVLPDISAADSERVQKEFQITVKQSFEDQTALVKSYQFKFEVKDMSFEPLADGRVRPKFKAELKEYRNA